VQARAQTRMRPRVRRSLTSTRPENHQARARDDPSLVGLDDAAVDTMASPEVVGVDDQAHFLAHAVSHRLQRSPRTGSLSQRPATRSVP